MRDQFSRDLSATITQLEDMIEKWGVKLIATPIINYLLFRLSAEKKGKIKADGRDN